MLVAVCNLLLMLLQMLAWTEYARAALLIEAPYYEEVFGNDVVIRYNISTAGIICVSLTDQGKKLLKDSCLVPTPVKDEGFNVLKLSFVPIGVMAVTISEVDEAGVTQFTAQTSLEVQQKSEIIPSYDWQPLRKWHSIPAGLETRLPLGGVGRKECRIPTPYRLQLPLPTPCSYFLRLDVFRHTTVNEILQAALKACNGKLSDLKCLALSRGPYPSHLIIDSGERLSSFLFGGRGLTLLGPSDLPGCS